MSRNDFSSKSPNSRPLKVGETLRQALAEIFLRGETHIPILDNSSITVSEVRMSPDLKNATAFVMPLAGSNKELILEALSEHHAHLRHLVADKVELRYMPRIHYKLDVSFEEAHRVNQLLNSPEVKRDLRRDGEEQP